MAFTIKKEYCRKCSRVKEYSLMDGFQICTVCDVIWDSEVWDKVIMQKPDRKLNNASR